jgi:cell wall-associated NlpC family hydrolase
LFDGRKNRSARLAAAITAALTVVGVALTTASPAAAAPETTNKQSIASAQARVDRLSDRADVVAERLDTVRTSRDAVRTRLQHVKAAISGQSREASKLRSEMASMAVDQVDTSAGAMTTSASSTEVPKSSETMLANVSIVSDDTGGRAEALTARSTAIQTLTERRVALRQRLNSIAGTDQAVSRQKQAIDAKVASASAVVDDLQAQAKAKAAKAAKERMGPALSYALAQVGKSYVFGAAGPSSFDCSGLTMAAWSQAGVSLPHSSSAQYNSGQHISESELQPGDLVFYYSPISHVGMYIGGGKIVNALNPGSGVKVSGLHDMPFSGAVRVG